MQTILSVICNQLSGLCWYILRHYNVNWRIHYTSPPQNPKLGKETKLYTTTSRVYFRLLDDAEKLRIFLHKFGAHNIIAAWILSKIRKFLISSIYSNPRRSNPFLYSPLLVAFCYFINRNAIDLWTLRALLYSVAEITSFVLQETLYYMLRLKKGSGKLFWGYDCYSMVTLGLVQGSTTPFPTLYYLFQ